MPNNCTTNQTAAYALYKVLYIFQFNDIFMMTC